MKTLLYSYARNLAHTEAMIAKLYEDVPLNITLNEGIDDISDQAKKQLRDLTAHRMVLLTEMAAATGHRLVEIKPPF